MGTADNRRTELLRTYPVKNLMLGGTFLRCCVNIIGTLRLSATVDYDGRMRIW